MSSPAPSLAGVLFDMDGLLIDSEPLWLEVERSVMVRLGGDWTLADQRHLLGGSLARSVSYMLAKASGDHPGNGNGGGRPTTEQVGQWLTQGMTDLVRSRGVALMPGAAELLAAVRAAGLPHALVTSSERAIMAAALAVTGLRFEVTVCGEDVARRKPAPEPYLRAASLLGVDPRGCVALEDSAAGVAAATAAGCGVIAVPTMPLPPGSGPVTVASLREITLPTLHAALAAQS